MATGATEFIDNTTADNSIPEIWSKELLVQREANLVFEKVIRTDYREAMSFGDVIHLGSVSDLAVRSKSANTAITYETQTETNKDITINVDEYAAIAVENITDVQSMLDLVSTYAPKMAYALAKSRDTAIAVLVDNLSASTAVGTLGVPLTYDDFLAAMQALDDANVPDEDRAFVVSNATATDMDKIDQFVHSDYATLNGAGMGKKGERAWVGQWHGVPIYKTNNTDGSNAAGHDNVLLHKATFGMAAQQMPKTFSMFDIDYLARKVASEQIYGVAELREDHGCWMKGR